jgi:hypothetical protein
MWGRVMVNSICHLVGSEIAYRRGREETIHGTNGPEHLARDSCPQREVATGWSSPKYGANRARARTSALHVIRCLWYHCRHMAGFVIVPWYAVSRFGPCFTVTVNNPHREAHCTPHLDALTIATSPRMTTVCGFGPIASPHSPTPPPARCASETF